MASQEPRICIIGAGFSGMTAAIQLKKRLGYSNFVIYEEHADFGGTWYANTYPGCRCDVMSHLYSLSFEPNPNWSETYSPQGEIWNYMKKVAERHNLYQNAKFEHQVKNLEWCEEGQNWRATIFNKKTKETTELVYDFIISGVGGLRLPRYPEEFDAFKGPKMHSAEWDHKIDLKGKKVGVIGNGASAIQIIPEIAPIVSELYSYQRTPSWIVPRVGLKFPKMIQSTFKTLPFLMSLYRLFIFLLNEIMFYAFQSGTWLNSFAQKMSYSFLKKETKNHIDLRRELTPNFKFGCKRVMVSSNYYSTFKRPNVHLMRKKIEKVEGDSITTVDGRREKLDVLILATGFRVQEFCFPMKIKGRKNVELLETWKSGPITYYGIMTSPAPNFFFLLGPNTGLGHNSGIFQIECQVTFTIKMIKECVRRGAKSVNVNPHAESDWMDWLEKAMKSTIWGNESCGNWYTNDQGKVTAIWPKNSTSYYRETRSPNMNDMDFTY